MKALLVDIGAGTMDVLVHDDETGEHFKAVVESPIRTLAKAAAKLAGNLVVTGCEMGGGAITGVLRDRARDADVAVTAAAAATLHHDPKRVETWGIRIVDEAEAGQLGRDRGYGRIELGDLSIDRLAGLVDAMGVAFEFDVVAVCAQDHGVAPAGTSHLDYRHNLFTERLDAAPFPHALLYEKGRVPPAFNRLTAIAGVAAGIPARKVYVMDSGMAAILGASMDVRVRGKERFMVLDIATSHTVGAAVSHGAIAGFFEYHTHDITLGRLEDLLRDLADGRLTHDTLLAEGGHGAYLRETVAFGRIDTIVATGPKRALIDGSSLPVVWGAPLGDNMMTGTVGLLEAVRRHQGLPEQLYR